MHMSRYGAELWITNYVIMFLMRVVKVRYGGFDEFIASRPPASVADADVEPLKSRMLKVL